MLAGAAGFAGTAAADDDPNAHYAAGMAEAARWAETRRGEVSIALLDEGGRLLAHRGRRVAGTASLLKPLLMTAYLRRASVRDRPLRDADRRLLGPMIRWSANAPATWIVDRLGAAAIERTGRLLGMSALRIRRPWGLSSTTAIDKVRFFDSFERHLPARHRPYALSLLRRIVPSQRWGVARAVPAGWRLYFKGGWGSGTGRFCHQSALLEKDGRQVVLSILTEHNPSHAYGTRTLEGVARRLLSGVE